MRNLTRVLIVDDSASMRRLIKNGIEADGRIQVVGEAGTALEAREAVKIHEPDAMTLDIEMPGMDGLEFLERLMKARPMPVVMISSLTTKGSEAAIKALIIGAVECVEKPRFGNAKETFDHLTSLLVECSRGVRGRNSIPTHKTLPEKSTYDWNGRIILMGASTGGVEAIERILKEFPEQCPPTMITQHMPEKFLQSFASRLNSVVQPKVSVGFDNQLIRQGEVIIAPGGDRHMLVSNKSISRVHLKDGPKRSGHRPSVDELFNSAIQYGQNVVAALLTGMGSDGAEGLLALRNSGATCIGQDQSSSIVYGMPKRAYEIGAVGIQLDLNHIAKKMLESASSNGQK